MSSEEKDLKVLLKTANLLNEAYYIMFDEVQFPSNTPGDLRGIHRQIGVAESDLRAWVGKEKRRREKIKKEPYELILCGGYCVVVKRESQQEIARFYLRVGYDAIGEGRRIVKKLNCAN